MKFKFKDSNVEVGFSEKRKKGKLGLYDGGVLFGDDNKYFLVNWYKNEDENKEQDKNKKDGELLLDSIVEII